jgi:uncharacterized LabA/DUF88 family protein
MTINRKLSTKKACYTFIFILISQLISKQEVTAFVATTSRIYVGSTTPSDPPQCYDRLSRRHALLRDQEPQEIDKDYDNFIKFATSDADDHPHPPSSSKDQTQQKIEAQQKQIDVLMEMIQSQNSNGKADFNPSAEDSTPSSLPPLKVMLFIDGTWLYYSIHEREDDQCPIMARYGKGWQYKYFFDWKALPGVICAALQDQDRGWSSHTTQPDPSTGINHPRRPRPMEIVRASVFTSYKADTPKTSFRYQMYQDMINANYDVHLMETVGKAEKCVDIQLAVEMLHYATVPDAYDVALLLSGDKDFMPALVRTRQKGRRVGIVSMRRGCNRALFESPNVKDYNVIWIEDYLDKLIKRKPANQLCKQNPHLSSFTLMKILNDFISKSGVSRVNSRDVGLYLKHMMVGDRSVSEEVKQSYGGLYQFLIISGAYVIIQIDDEERKRKRNSDRASYWVALRDGANQKLLEEAKHTQFTKDEKIFFDQYSFEPLQGKKEYYYFTTKWTDNSTTVNIAEPVLELPEIDQINKPGDISVDAPEEPAHDYNTFTMVRLKEVCRERGLPVSGKKSELVERIVTDIGERSSHQLQEGSREPIKSDHTPPRPEDYLHGLVLEYLQASGGRASSRDVGRYLAANKATEERMNNERARISALQELKELFGGLKQYVMQSPTFFYQEQNTQEDPHDFSFVVSLKASDPSVE